MLRNQQVVGKHRGALFYTIGQRKGLNLGGMKEPFFVAKKDMENNIVYVSSGSDDILYKDIVSSKGFNYLVDESKVDGDVIIKTRHSNVTYKGKVTKNENGFVSVKTEEKIKAVTPGQELVLYKDNLCLGGGTIIEHG